MSAFAIGLKLQDAIIKLEYHTVEAFEKEKLLRFWIQSFLAGVPYVAVGFRNDAGVLIRTEKLRTKDITQKVKANNYWQPHTSGSIVGVENPDDGLNRIARGMFGGYVNASVSADGNYSSPLDDDLALF